MWVKCTNCTFGPPSPAPNPGVGCRVGPNTKGGGVLQPPCKAKSGGALRPQTGPHPLGSLPFGVRHSAASPSPGYSKTNVLALQVVSPRWLLMLVSVFDSLVL